MNYTYLFLGVGLSITTYFVLKFKNIYCENKDQDTNQDTQYTQYTQDINQDKFINGVDYGFGYILNEYPILTLYIKGQILNKKKNNLLQTAYPNGFPEDSYVIISFDENFTDYIGVVNLEEFKQIKTLLVYSNSEKIYLLKFILKKEYLNIRDQFAEAQLHLLTHFN